MNRLEDISQNVDFGPKLAGLDFSRTPNLNFLKEYHKISFYTNKYAKLWFPTFIIWNHFYFDTIEIEFEND